MTTARLGLFRLGEGGSGSSRSDDDSVAAYWRTQFSTSLRTLQGDDDRRRSTAVGGRGGLVTNPPGVMTTLPLLLGDPGSHQLRPSKGDNDLRAGLAPARAAQVATPPGVATCWCGRCRPAPCGGRHRPWRGRNGHFMDCSTIAPSRRHHPWRGRNPCRTPTTPITGTSRHHPGRGRNRWALPQQAPNWCQVVSSPGGIASG